MGCCTTQVAQRELEGCRRVRMKNRDVAMASHPIPRREERRMEWNVEDDETKSHFLPSQYRISHVARTSDFVLPRSSVAKA